MRRATVGCRTHSGWAALVVVAEAPEFPEVMYRRRIEICDPKIRGSKQPYHTAEPLPFADATALLNSCAESARDLALRALHGLLGELREHRFEASGFGLVMGSGRLLPPLDKILASHALIHTAEGEFYREVMADVARECGLALTGVKEKEAFDQGAAMTGLASEALQKRVAEMGRSIGPPWTQDQKLATVAGWLALAADGVKTKLPTARRSRVTS